MRALSFEDDPIRTRMREEERNKPWWAKSVVEKAGGSRPSQETNTDAKVTKDKHVHTNTMQQRATSISSNLVELKK